MSVTEDDFGVSAHIDNQRNVFHGVWPFCQYYASGVCTDMTRYTRQHIDLRVAMGIQVKLCSRASYSAVGGQCERGAAKFNRVDAE